jgi:hypothetical protein
VHRLEPVRVLGCAEESLGVDALRDGHAVRPTPPAARSRALRWPPR